MKNIMNEEFNIQNEAPMLRQSEVSKILNKQQIFDDHKPLIETQTIINEIVAKIEKNNIDKNNEQLSYSPIRSSNFIANNVIPGLNNLPTKTPQQMSNSIYDTTTDNNLILNCLTLAKEQIGCRLLQKKIEENTQLASDIVYPIIQDQFVDLSCDQFGNYFVQKVIDYLKIEQIEDLIQTKIPSSFRDMCFSQHGTRVIQKIFERIIPNDRFLMYYNFLLKPNMKDFILDPNAYHIIIQLISLLNSPQNDFVVEFLSNNIYNIATNKHSCGALQKCIEYANPQQKLKLLNAVAKNSFDLFTDQYGNYAVQNVLRARDPDINQKIVLNLFYDFYSFSSQKYSSNVIEKCFEYCNDETKDLIVEKLCNPQIVRYLLFDMYGNYVLQKTMSYANEPYLTKYYQLVGEHLDSLRKVNFGMKLYNKLITMFPSLNFYNKRNVKLKCKKKGSKVKSGTIPPFSSKIQIEPNGYTYQHQYAQPSSLYQMQYNNNVQSGNQSVNNSFHPLTGLNQNKANKNRFDCLNYNN